MTSREQFEAWYVPIFCANEIANMPLTTNGQYRSVQQQIASLAWQASRAQALEEAARVADKCYANFLYSDIAGRAIRKLKDSNAA